MTVFKSDALFEEIKEQLYKDEQLAKKVSSTFKIIVTADDGSVKSWIIDAKSHPPYMGHDDRSVELEVNMKDSDLMKMAAGKLNPDQMVERSSPGLLSDLEKDEFVETSVPVKKFIPNLVGNQFWLPESWHQVRLTHGKHPFWLAEDLPQAYFRGKMRLKGLVPKAMRLNQLMKAAKRKAKL